MPPPMRFFLFLLFSLLLSHCAPPEQQATAPEPLKAKAQPPSFSDQPFEPAVLSAEERRALQHGDILLRRGFGMVSNYIASFLREEYEVTHCGFVVLQEGQEPQILHTASDEQVDGIYLEPLEDFLADSYHSSLALVRTKGTQAQREAVVQQCLGYLERDIPFDMRFDHSDSSEMYCVEMMWYAFRQVYEDDLLPRRIQGVGVEVFRMDNFFDTTHFELIFNQLPKKDWN